MGFFGHFGQWRVGIWIWVVVRRYLTVDEAQNISAGMTLAGRSTG